MKGLWEYEKTGKRALIIRCIDSHTSAILMEGLENQFGKGRKYVFEMRDETSFIIRCSGGFTMKVMQTALDVAYKVMLKDVEKEKSS